MDKKLETLEKILKELNEQTYKNITIKIRAYNGSFLSLTGVSATISLLFFYKQI